MKFSYHIYNNSEFGKLQHQCYNLFTITPDEKFSSVFIEGNPASPRL